MAGFSRSLRHEGVSIDIVFGDPRPSFGDLFRICGSVHPNFPPTGDFGFDQLADLQFDQVDDYFGVRSLSNEGSDVVVWLYPLVNGEPVHHHTGPFDGVRLDYSILRNPARHAEFYLRCVTAFAAYGVGTVYRCRVIELGLPPDLTIVRTDIESVIRYWSSKGIEVGSDKALQINY